jgi:hypothetical protein
MSDYFPAEIHIGGPVPRAALDGLIEAMMAQGGSLSDYGGAEPTRDAILTAIQEGATVGLYDAEACFGQFPDLEAFLVEHGIHFNGHNDAYGECDAENVFYRGGPEPVRMPATQAGEGLVACRDILAALDDRSLSDGEKLMAIRGIVAPPQAAPLEPIRLV